MNTYVYKVFHYASTCEGHFGQNGQKPHENYKIQNQHFFWRNSGKTFEMALGGKSHILG